jgi:predicted HD phosphohydrolase
MRRHKTIEFIYGQYLMYGGAKYSIDEPLSIVKHSVQTAEYFMKRGRDYHKVSAGFLHDFGHVLHEPIAPSAGVDDRHEFTGATVLELLGLSPHVTEPIRDHVAAKRFLCTVNSQYRAGLSKGSALSLELQGGLMSQRELFDFRCSDYFSDAIALRLADDQAKDTKKEELDMLRYQDHIYKSIKPGFEPDYKFIEDYIRTRTKALRK